mgnify:CR=1 FL=1
MKLRIIVGLSLVIISTVFSVDFVYAHGFGERYDLPIPINYFLLGAAGAVAVSFFVIGWFMRHGAQNSEYPRLNLFKWKWAIQIGNILSVFGRFISVILLIVTVYAGLFGVHEPLDNFAPTFVWIIWWVGIGYISAFLGNIWAVLNPWYVIFRWAEIFLGINRRHILPWPKKLDSWPALMLFFLFAWVENVYSGAAQPFNLAILIILYSIFTFTGMTLFGKHVWLKNADPFFVLFSLFARFSPTEVRVIKNNNYNNVCENCTLGCFQNSDLPDCVDCYECWENSEKILKQFSLRPWSVGLSRGERVTPALAAFHITALATVTFDGFAETPAWVSIQTLVWNLISYLPGRTSATIETLGILIIPIVFALVYIQVCRLVSKVSAGQMSHKAVSLSFVFSLVPIALAYNLSHYLSFILISGQQILSLLSDPLGIGWNIFGTANHKVNIAVIDARFAWITSVVSIVLGHIISVFIAHVISLRRTTSNKIAVRSQYPMLALMVFYTVISLWIVAQPIVE